MMDDLSSRASFEIRQCTRESCRLRFSVETADRRAERCPQCRAPAVVVGKPFRQAAIPQAGEQQSSREAGPQVEILLDNIRSAWNVGSMMRTADGAGVRRVHLCGVSATPENPKVAKTALGAEKSLSWSFHPDGLAAVQSFKDQGLPVWALEGGDRAESLFGGAIQPPVGRMVLVVGNELTGIDPGLLELCDRVVSLPMLGVKGSLNVAVAFGIAVYAIRFGLGRVLPDQ
jgi:23S rRNA (guanosine2251-2'-O)-methyltransferase